MTRGGRWCNGKPLSLKEGPAQNGGVTSEKSKFEEEINRGKKTKPVPPKKGNCCCRVVEHLTHDLRISPTKKVERKKKNSVEGRVNGRRPRH